MIRQDDDGTVSDKSGESGFERIDQVSRAGHEINEDAFLATRRTAWVLDGASGLSDSRFTTGQSDAQWLVEKAVSKIESLSQEPLGELMLALVEELNTAFETEVPATIMEQYQRPSAALIGLQLEGRSLTYIQLGDCRAIIKPSEETVAFLTPAGPLAELDQAVLEKLKREAELRDLNPSQARQHVLEDLQANRNLVNTETGYQSLTVGPNRIFNPVIHRQMISDGAICLLMSDGFMRLIDLFEVYTPDSLLEAASTRGLSLLVDELRELENHFPGNERYPRFRQFDDATALLVQAHL